MTRTTAPRILGYVLAGLAEFWEDAIEVRDGADGLERARGYLARSSPREEVIGQYLGAAASHLTAGEIGDR